MGVYLMCFGASCLFLKISDKFKKNKIAKILIISIALLIPCILAGLRHYSIGTDIEKILPPMRRFGSNRSEKKKTIIEKLKKFFEKYFGLGIAKDENDASGYNSEVETDSHLTKVPQKHENETVLK